MAEPTYLCACRAPATLYISHDCPGKASLKCSGACATCDEHAMRDITAQLDHAGGTIHIRRES